MIGYLACFLLGVIATLFGQALYVRHWYTHKFKPDFDNITWP